MNREISIDISVPDCTEVKLALSYLIAWCPTTYNKLILCDDFPERQNGNIMAYYKNTLNGNSYTIGAIWDSRLKTGSSAEFVGRFQDMKA